MNSNLLLEGVINGLKSIGAIISKSDDKFVYLDIKKGSEIDNEKELKNTKEIVSELFNLGLKVKRIE